MNSGYDDAAVDRLDYHGSMLRDQMRTESFMRAIMAAVEPGDVVVDIGTGTGVLALFAAKAGAQRVYAIEQEPIVELARDIAAANGFEDRVVFVPGASTDVELPELGDVLVTETIGNAALDEGIIRWIGDARARLLKPGATVIPSALGLMVAALELPRDFADAARFSEPMHSLDFSAMLPHFVNGLWADDLSPASVVSEPTQLYRTSFTDDPGEVRAGVEAAARRDATVHAIGLWFTADLGSGITISNAPPSPVPSWEQGVLLLEGPVSVETGDAIAIELSATTDGRTWTWRVNDGAAQSTSLLDRENAHG